MNAEREEVQVPMPRQPVQQGRKGGPWTCTPGTFLRNWLLKCFTVNVAQQTESMIHPSYILFYDADLAI